MGRLFGTDGIRGEANRYPMDGMTAFSVGQAVTCVTRRSGKRARIIIATDTRVSGSMLAHSLAAGVASMGGDAYLAGVLPTPGVAFLARFIRADAGIMISASHNPYADNGIKIFSGSGYKLSDPEEARIEDLMLNGGMAEMAPPAKQIGRIRTMDDAQDHYLAFLKALFPEDLSMRAMKMVLDTANGATHAIAPALFTALGAEVDVLHNTPDGTNINENCGSQFTGDLRSRVVEKGAAIGLAFDGDGDRLIAVDERGQEVTGDPIILICARALKQRGRLKNDRVVSTVMSNLGFRLACHTYGMTHHAAKVGDRYVLEEMKRLGAVIGGEDSGHLIFLDHHTTGDGILAGIQLIAAMLRLKQPLSELAAMMTRYPQVLINVRVREKPDLSTLAPVVAAVQGAESELGSQGRILLRYSGTEDLCRVMVEGPTREATEMHCRRIADAVASTIG